MHPETRVRIAEGVITKEVGDELVLLDVERGVYYGLHEVSARIWQLLGAGESVGTTMERLLEEYDVERETLEQDVARLIGELREAGLVVLE